MLRQKNLPQASEDLKILFNNLHISPEMKSRVVGYSDVDINPLFKRHLVNIGNVLDDQSHNQSLLRIINNIKSDKSVDKPYLYSALLQKYLGIDVGNTSRSPIQLSVEPNAYHSLPDQNHPDKVLHECFLQPSRLFDVLPENRRYIGDHTPTRNREWRWDGYKKECDSAPIFRKIIQVTILSEILEDKGRKEESSANQAFRDQRIEALKPQLKALKQTLLGEIFSNFNALFDRLEFQELPGYPKGLFGDDPSSWDREQFPEMFSIYPLLRVLSGQPPVDPDEAVAKRLTKQSNHKIPYGLAWLISQFNIPLIMYSLLMTMNSLRAYWRSKGVVELGLVQLIIFSFCFAPIFAIFNLINGVTNLPFTFARLFFRNFTVLNFLDTLAIFKDASLFIGFLWMIGPFLSFDFFGALGAIMAMGFVGSMVGIVISFWAIQNLAPSFVVSAMERFFSFLYEKGCGLLDLFVPVLFVNPEIIPAERQQIALTLPRVSREALKQEALLMFEQLKKLNYQSLDEAKKIQMMGCVSFLNSGTSFELVQAMSTAQRLLDTTLDPAEMGVTKNLIQHLGALIGENNPPFKEQLTRDFHAITAAEEGVGNYQLSQPLATQFCAYLTQRAAEQPGREIEGVTPRLFEKFQALSGMR